MGTPWGGVAQTHPRDLRVERNNATEYTQNLGTDDSDRFLTERMKPISDAEGVRFQRWDGWDEKAPAPLQATAHAHWEVGGLPVPEGGSKRQRTAFRD